TAGTSAHAGSATFRLHRGSLSPRPASPQGGSREGQFSLSPPAPTAQKQILNAQIIGSREPLEGVMTEVCRIASAVAKGGNVDASDILELRRTIYRDGVVSRDEAGALFDIDRRRASHSDAWSDLFVEAITDYALNQEPPAGYLAEDTANFLVDEISKQA